MDEEVSALGTLVEVLFPGADPIIIGSHFVHKQLGRSAVPVFEFRAVDKRREDYAEKGTVVARNEAEAKQKLKQLDLQVTTLKRMGGLAGLIKAFTADIR